MNPVQPDIALLMSLNQQPILQLLSNSESTERLYSSNGNASTASILVKYVFDRLPQTAKYLMHIYSDPHGTLVNGLVLTSYSVVKLSHNVWKMEATDFQHSPRTEDTILVPSTRMGIQGRVSSGCQPCTPGMHNEVSSTNYRHRSEGIAEHKPIWSPPPPGERCSSPVDGKHEARHWVAGILQSDDLWCWTAQNRGEETECCRWLFLAIFRGWLWIRCLRTGPDRWKNPRQELSSGFTTAYRQRGYLTKSWHHGRMYYEASAAAPNMSEQSKQ